MRRIFTLLSFLLLPLLGMSQLRVVEGSFKEIPGFVDMSEKTDDNNKPFAVVIIKTLNINEQERAKLRFSSDAMSYVEVEYRVGEVWLYVSYYASFLKIKHPDLSSAPDFYLPFDMQPRHGYELVLEKYNVAPAPDAQTINYLIVRCDQPDASICIDGSFVGMKEGSKALGVGEKHSWQIDCGLYHSESGEVTITEGEPVTVERNLRPAYGFLKVTSSPENGATVFINNNKVGTTPYTSERLQSGSYNVRVMKEMFSLSEKSFLVKDNETTVANMVLNPNFATLSLNTDPASDIFIDGERVAKGQWNGRLSSGTHLVEARKPSHRNSSLKVNLSNGENKTLTIPNPEPIYSMLDINSQPMGAKILIDGEDFGTTPRVIKNILVGEHTLSLVKQGCAKLEKTFTLKEKEMLSLNEKLESGKIITVTTDKEGDDIYVDGKLAGHSPLDVSMGYGRHTVKAIRNGKSVEKSFDVSENGGESSLLLKFSRNQTITVNGVSFEMVYVEGGSFDMGATSEQGSDAYSDEKPVHRVTLSDYYIGKCEVTQELWEAVMGSNPSYFKGAQNPVEQVSWNDCQKFISRLNSLTGRTFRLPTEAEWEYAARGGKKSLHYKYSGSGNIDDVAWYSSNSGSSTHAVGTKSLNELGICDMSGNVYEWCSDWEGGYSAGAQTNPQGPSSGSKRVLRGGSWYNYARYCRVSFRFNYAPDNSFICYGVRLVLVPNEVPSIPQQQEQYSPQQEYGGGFSNQTITVNGVSFEMVYVEGGSFDMGATSEQGSEADNNEKPVHSVTLSGYYIGRCEVTQELWEAVMGSNPSSNVGAKNPVEQVSWYDCQRFIRRLNSLTGRTFRLPTEAEWEYAARGGNQSRHYKYSGSDNIDDVAWYNGNSGDNTHAVGTKTANELGIYDMSGNVWEWCSDWYGGYSAGAQTNPQGPSSGLYRVLRGGSWYNYARYCRVSFRFNYAPDNSFICYGVRLVLVPNEVPSIPQQQEQYSPQQEYGGGFSNQTITVNGVSFEMVYVEGGSFDMGATTEQGSDAWDNEYPVHSVTLSGYYIGKCEVTQELWEAVMGSNPSKFKGAQNPVEYVCWNDCQEFVSRLNSLTGMTFRLPTEAEWEYAARGGKKSRHYKYSGSNNIFDVAWHDGNSGGSTHAVGTKTANELGIYDMSGNVLEWCSDWEGGYSAGAQTNPQGPSSGYYRVLRGGSLDYDARLCRVSNRYGHRPGLCVPDFGLRLVLVP